MIFEHLYNNSNKYYLAVGDQVRPPNVGTWIRCIRFPCIKSTSLIGATIATCKQFT